ncbi:TPA: type II toxin-antitoxin system YoeB family toxin [Enterobacter kobei]|uniref:type II toxin-antitoxin system YoeB family toxin n=1 Tax=Enterobacter kobei TaxID=208224 RepID=UPI002075F0B6|nr:type II toxin-antitoxin system YoeB family toxin [Enterobacter kobei]MCM7486532.1 type II toxin-antitoxin system YoeB family toxin [Enterobacter kobei]HCM9089386.1 type II toxin-antitoxin system YoeB family toxin [Enterobacter kobei]HCM9164213.1 type II toxin-antitoxin system YoeB family toxin [Enterobacter kobei]
MTYYNFTDCEQQSRFSKNKHVPVPHAAMRKYYEWRRKVRDFGHDPKTAANSVCDANPEKLHGDTYSFRLTQEHRVVYTKTGCNITVHSIGGHYVRQ